MLIRHCIRTKAPETNVQNHTHTHETSFTKSRRECNVVNEFRDVGSSKKDAFICQDRKEEREVQNSVVKREELQRQRERTRR